MERAEEGICVCSVSGECASVCVEVLRGCVFVWGRMGKEGVMMV